MIQYSEQELKDRVLKASPRPTSIAFVGRDIWQAQQAISLLTGRFCRNQEARQYDLVNFTQESHPRVTKTVDAEVEAAVHLMPLVGEVKLIVVDHPHIGIPKRELPKSTLALFINPPNPDKAELAFSIYPLYGRSLLTFTKSTLQGEGIIGQVMSGKNDLEMFASNLYSGDTRVYVQELHKLGLLASAFPADYVNKVRQYVFGSLDSRFAKFYKLMQKGSQAIPEILKFIYQSVYVDGTLNELVIFNVIAQHFFVNMLLSSSRIIQTLPKLSDDSKLAILLDTYASFDKLFKCVVFRPSLVLQHGDKSLPGVPSIKLSLLGCPGPGNCSSTKCCCLAESTVALTGCSLAGQVLGCPLQSAQVLNILAGKLKSLSSTWRFLLCGDEKAYSDPGVPAFAGGFRENVRWDSMPFHPVGEFSIQSSRMMSKTDIVGGTELFQQADRKFKSSTLSAAEGMSIFFSLCSWVLSGKTIKLVDEEEQ